MDTRQSQRCKFKEIAKNSNFRIFHETQCATHLLKLVDKMCKYEMDLASIVEEQSGHDSVYRRTNEQGETSIPPFNFVEEGTGYNYLLLQKYLTAL